MKLPKWRKCCQCSRKIFIEKEDHFKVGNKYFCYDDNGYCDSGFLNRHWIRPDNADDKWQNITEEEARELIKGQLK